jgi:nickel-dependent lactate racemase
MNGKAVQGRTLTDSEVRNVVAAFMEDQGFGGKRVLGIIPDHTRTAPIDLMFRTLYELLIPRVRQLDFLIALGTHPPMSDDAIDRRLGLAPGERQSRYGRTQVFNHHWNDPRELVAVGRIDEEHVAALSRGMMHDPVVVTVNRRVFDYDTVLIIGPTFPHEVVGFSGGNKYLFPGISGPEIIHMFHWLGALITNPVIIGTKFTPVREVVDAAATMLSVRRLCISLVVADEGLAGIYCGTPEDAWSAAADLSGSLHIVRKERPFSRVLSCAPPMYDELWTGGKATYKLEPVVADGGELIIYAPHIRQISVSHGDVIERIGYHVRDFFTKQMDRYAGIPKGVLAHSTHVKGIGTFDGGIESPRMQVVLATGIPEAVCRRINLGYRDPATIRQEEWMGREDEGVLHVPKAGEVLYRLTQDPFVRSL